MKKLISIFILTFSLGIAFADSLRTVYNPWTGKQDYVNAGSFNKITVSTLTFNDTNQTIPIYRGTTPLMTFGSANSLFFGQNAGVTTSTNTGNTSFGAGTLQSLSQYASSSTAFGFGASRLQSRGIGGTSFGYEAMGSMTTGEYNTAVGIQALAGNAAGFDYGTLGTLTSGYNTAIGAEAMRRITTGYKNTCIGSFSCDSLSTGIENTIVGAGAAPTWSGSNQITIIGRSAGNTNNGDKNTYLGYGSYMSGGPITYGTALGAESIITESYTAQIGVAGTKLNVSSMTVSSATVNGQLKAGAAGFSVIVSSNFVANGATGYQDGNWVFTTTTTFPSSSGLFFTGSIGPVLSQQTAANIKPIISGAAGMIIGCSDCSTVPVCISTGAAAYQWALITNKGSACN